MFVFNSTNRSPNQKLAAPAEAAPESPTDTHKGFWEGEEELGEELQIHHDCVPQTTAHQFNLQLVQVEFQRSGFQRTCSTTKRAKTGLDEDSNSRVIEPRQKHKHHPLHLDDLQASGIPVVHKLEMTTFSFFCLLLLLFLK